MNRVHVDLEKSSNIATVAWFEIKGQILIKRAPYGRPFSILISISGKASGSESGVSKKMNFSHISKSAGRFLLVVLSIGFFMHSSEPAKASITSNQANEPGTVVGKKLKLSSGVIMLAPKSGTTLPSMPVDQVIRTTLPAQPVFFLVSRDKPVGILPEEEISPSLDYYCPLSASPKSASLNFTASCAAVNSY